MSSESKVQRSTSPATTGRSSSRSKVDDSLLKKDKGYRRYASKVERVLSSFETALEGWADYISFLGRLLKALQDKPEGPVDIPHKALVAKRLSQCLNPVLPSGVHQKTLDVYTYIFSTIGKEQLSLDLPLYLPGLTPVLSFASLSVKPTVLLLFENYILAARPKSLRPALKAIILALLPGLEEESSEEFERTLGILESLKNAVGLDEQKISNETDMSGHQYFWQCLFLASITSSSRRAGALAYLIRNLPHLGAGAVSETRLNGHGKQGSFSVKFSPSIETVTAPDPGLLIRCFCVGLQDEQLLTQRGFLDLLVTHLPLYSAVIRHKVVREDLIRLVTSASSVVTRRDMSLNRRLWSWFLGPETSTSRNEGSPVALKAPESNGVGNQEHESLEEQSNYFKRFGLEPLVQSIEGMIKSSFTNPAERARPLRICLSLMDRWEIGGLVIPQIFSPAVQSVWKYQTVAPSRDSYAEVLRSGNVFFDGVESGLIWTEIYKTIARAFSFPSLDVSKTHESLDLVLFITTNFNIREEEMLIIHMPLTCLVLLLNIRMFMKQPSMIHEALSTQAAHIALKITNRLFDLIPHRAFILEDGTQEGTSAVEGSQHLKLEDHEILNVVDTFYTHNQGNLDVASPPFSATTIGRLVFQEAIKLVTQCLLLDTPTTINESVMAIFDIIARKVTTTRISSTVLSSFHSSLANRTLAKDLKSKEINNFPIICAKVSTLEAICRAPSSRSRSLIPERLVRQLIPSLVASLWRYLSPSNPKYQVEAVRCIWRLQSLSSDLKMIESTLSGLMVSSEESGEGLVADIENVRRFITLWTHSPLTSSVSQSRRSSLVQTKHNSTKLDSTVRHEFFVLKQPLLLVLDVLDAPESELFSFVVSWLESLPNIKMILDMLVDCLNQILSVSTKAPDTGTDNNGGVALNTENEDLGLCLYYLQTINNLMQCSSDKLSPALASSRSSSETSEHPLSSNQEQLAHICLGVLERRFARAASPSDVSFRLNQIALSLIRQLLLGSTSASFHEIEVDVTLMSELLLSIRHAEHSFQVSFMDVILEALRARVSQSQSLQPALRRQATSRDLTPVALSLSIPEKEDWKPTPVKSKMLPSKLMECLKSGLTSPNCRSVLDSWVRFLNNCLPLYAENIFQVLIPITDCLCKSLATAFKDVQNLFAERENSSSSVLEPALVLLLTGLEQSLAIGHDRLMEDEATNILVKSPEQSQGFFGNMVSGVFTGDSNRTKSMTANNRLTVLLCFKDAIRVCFEIWSWGGLGAETSSRDSSSSASFNYTTLRLRNRTRRIFENLFAAEALECLETLIELWCQFMESSNTNQSSSVLNLLQILDGSRPKNTIPAIFNAIYSRTNPGALEPARKSTLTSNLSDTNLSTFLVAYARSLDDDAMDEIWSDCMTFLKDVLANPMPHRQTLPRLLEFTAILGEKVDNTNFGEQRKMRRELADLFVRLLTATLTIRPIGFSYEPSQTLNPEKISTDAIAGRRSLEIRAAVGTDGVLPVLASITPKLSKILVDTDRVLAVATIASTQVIVPTIRSKSFPENLTRHMLDLLIALANVPEAVKSWKRDVTEVFNDAKFFGTSVRLVEDGWFPVLRQWSLLDKERMPEMLSRLSTPTAAGLMFGVGASSARLEADRKTQLNLRRIATMILAAPDDTFVANLTVLQEKLIDLVNATAASSPSSLTRAEIYMVIRALLLKTSPIHLSSFWPVVNTELCDAISNAFPESDEEYNVNCLLQACKLLDTLLTLGLEDFQMQEWLFITDTTDAVYRPSNCSSVALLDELAEGLDASQGGSLNYINPLTANPQVGKRRPLLTAELTRGIKPERIMDTILRPFFRQLSISTFENTYSMDAPDLKACLDDLIADLFDDSTLV